MSVHLSFNPSGSFPLPRCCDRLIIPPSQYRYRHLRHESTADHDNDDDSDLLEHSPGRRTLDTILHLPAFHRAGDSAPHLPTITQQNTSLEGVTVNVPELVLRSPDATHDPGVRRKTVSSGYDPRTGPVQEDVYLEDGFQVVGNSSGSGPNHVRAELPGYGDEEAPPAYRW